MKRSNRALVRAPDLAAVTGGTAPDGGETSFADELNAIIDEGLDENGHEIQD